MRRQTQKIDSQMETALEEEAQNFDLQNKMEKSGIHKVLKNGENLIDIGNQSDV